ncbi:MAG: hypothetical protein ABI380_12145 [Edaphobacter sp.]
MKDASYLEISIFLCGHVRRMTVSVLLIGNDPGLLNSRVLLLEYERYSVSSVCGLKSLAKAERRDVALVVLCYTLDGAEQDEAIRLIRDESSTAMVLILLAPNEPIRHPEYASASMADGPNLFLAAIRILAERMESGELA